MFGRDLIFENMFDASLFDVAATPRYGAMYTGEHFDYIADIRDIAACSHVRGSCTRFERAAADLIALFISRFVEVPIAITNIPVDLNPSPVGQTDRQRFYSGGHITGDGRLVGLSSFSGSGCRIDLRWHDGTAPGSRVIGS